MDARQRVPGCGDTSGRRPRTIAFVACPGMEALDVTGPLAVFGGANRLHRQAGGTRPPYRTEILACRVGPVLASDGPRLEVDRGYGAVRGGIDTLLVAGGPEIGQALASGALIAWLRRIARASRTLQRPMSRHSQWHAVPDAAKIETARYRRNEWVRGTVGPLAICP